MGDLVIWLWGAGIGWEVRRWWHNRRAVPSIGGDQLLQDMRASIDRDSSRWALGGGWRVTLRRTFTWGGRRWAVEMVELKEGTDNG